MTKEMRRKVQEIKQYLIIKANKKNTELLGPVMRWCFGRSVNL